MERTGKAMTIEAIETGITQTERQAVLDAARKSRLRIKFEETARNLTAGVGGFIRDYRADISGACILCLYSLAAGFGGAMLYDTTRNASKIAITQHAPQMKKDLVKAENKDKIVVELEEKILKYFKDGKLIKQYHVRVGKEETPTPTGDGYISEKRDPGFFENLVGPNKGKIKRYAELTNGQSIKIPYENMRSLAFKIMGNDDERFSIHSHYDDDTIGKAISHGCIGMTIEDMLDLYPLIEPGTMVIIE